MSHVFVMEWAAILRDLVIGLLIAGAIAAWVPPDFWRAFFITGHPVAAAIWGPLVGPFVAMLSFVCSIGNVPLAAVLWKDGLSFGGVTAFIFADLLILPILNIYRKYYGARMAAFVLVVVLRRHGRGRLPGGGDLQPAGHRPGPDRRDDPGQRRVLELHDLAEHLSSCCWPRPWSSGSCGPAAGPCCA